MKAFTFFIALILFFTSCSKQSSQPQPDDPNSVTIGETKYPIIKIGSQTWMAVNYNGAGGTNYNESSINDPKYGKLYTYQEITSIKLPTGWRLPTTEDFSILIRTYKGDVKPLLSTTGWNEKLGTNSSGFNVFPAGYYSYGFNVGRYENFGNEAAFFTTSFFSTPPVRACFVFISYSGTAGAVISNTITSENDRASIRLIKNE
jgi:uncharacterized protein (TIGR02145 family)